MKAAILGKKIGMTRLCDENGVVTPVTVIQAGPCTVMQVRSMERDGYHAVQLGFDDRPARLCTKAELGNAKKAGLDGGRRFVREFRLNAAPTVKPGEDVTVKVLEGCKHVDVTGTSKGRGWAGTIKRWNFSRQPTSHGNSVNHRTGGGLGRQHSISSGVPKGKRMAGHFGVERVTVRRFDIREPSNPVSISTFPTPAEADYCAKGGHFGPHNIHENRPDGFVSSETIFATYQNAGVRVFDIKDQYRPTEIAAFVPPKPAKLMDRRPNRDLVIQSCDVFVDRNGLVYSNDYNGGLYILEYTA